MTLRALVVIPSFLHLLSLHPDSSYCCPSAKFSDRSRKKYESRYTFPLSSVLVHFREPQREIKSWHGYPSQDDLWHILCVTSRPEMDIRVSLTTGERFRLSSHPLTFRQFPWRTSRLPEPYLPSIHIDCEGRHCEMLKVRDVAVYL